MLTACSVLALAACGGGGDNVDEPKIDRPLAAALAARSDEVATLLERGDRCRAKNEADALRRELTAAINSRRIPDVYLEDFSGLVNEIAAQIVCRVPQLPPPPTDDEADDDHGHGDGDKDKDKGKGKGKHKHKGDD